MAGLNRGDKRAPIAERGDDLYETPPEAVHALLKHERLPHYLWEPACGPGSITRVLRDAGKFVHATDLVNYRWEDRGEEPGFAEHGVDFLMARSTYTAAPIGAIVTNPPYKIASEFAAHAIRLCPRVYMLLPLTFISAGNKDDRAGRERRFALDGGSLARVLVFANRLPMMHRAGWEGKRASTQVVYAWFCWDAAHHGETIIKRISWEPIGGAKPAAPRRKRALHTETASMGL